MMTNLVRPRSSGPLAAEGAGAGADAVVRPRIRNPCPPMTGNGLSKLLNNHRGMRLFPLTTMVHGQVPSAKVGQETVATVLWMAAVAAEGGGDRAVPGRPSLADSSRSSTAGVGLVKDKVKTGGGNQMTPFQVDPRVRMVVMCA